jgi:hypothetical protein
MIYNCYDIESGMVVSTFMNVQDSQRLTGATVTSGSAAVIVASTEQLWPGMRVVGKGIPANTLVLSIDSATGFTMTANGTATNAGLIIIAHAYVDVEVVRAIHIEHYRDLFGGSTAYGVTSGGNDTGATGSLEGAGVYITNPTRATVNNGSGTATMLSGTLVAAQSDVVSHTPPRTQTRDVTVHFLICKDGTILPVAVFPGMHLAQSA